MSRLPPHCPRCRQLSLHWTAWNYLTVTLHTGSQSHRLHTVHFTGVPGPSLTMHCIGIFRICSYLPFSARFIIYSCGWGFSVFSIFWHWLAMSILFLPCQTKQKRQREYSCVCIQMTRGLCLYLCLHVYWCGNVGAQSRSVTTVSTSKHDLFRQDTGGLVGGGVITNHIGRGSELDKCFCQLSPISEDEKIHDVGSNWQTKEQITTNSLHLLQQVSLNTRHGAVTPEPELSWLHKWHKESHVSQCHKERH